ncbi:MAG TPA: polymer-forming cytoskeletal protein [Actinomycetota bacterium]|jgi:cytoskeletal protein CcmA (bactofilin family)
MRRFLGVAALAFVVSFALAGTALAADGTKDFVVLTGSLLVPAGDTVNDAVIFDGDATIEGTVTGNVVVFNGDASIVGDVNGDVVAFNGRVLVGEGATVHGNVRSRLSPRIAGQVDGTVGGVNFNVDWGNLRLASRLAIWVATTVSSFLLGLLIVLFAPRAADAVASAAEARTGAAAGWGFLVLIGLPIFAVLAIVTLVGIPFGLGLLLALGLLYWLGYVASAYLLGRRLLKSSGSRVGAFAIGWGILRVVALVPILAGLLWVVATAVGLGAIAIAARAAGRKDATASMRPAPPTPPMPAMPA